MSSSEIAWDCLSIVSPLVIVRRLNVFTCLFIRILYILFRLDHFLLSRSDNLIQFFFLLRFQRRNDVFAQDAFGLIDGVRSEEHTSELQSRLHLVCRLLLEKKNRSSIDASS